MNLDEVDIAQCTVCGKLFRAEPHKGLCRECSLELGEAGEIIEVPNTPHPPVQPEQWHRLPLENIQSPDSWDTLELFESPLLGDSLVCVRCNSRPTIQDSDFCLRCQVALFSDLGEAATELFDSAGLPRERDRLTSGLADAFEEKRRRAPRRRLSPVTIGRLKT